MENKFDLAVELIRQLNGVTEKTAQRLVTDLTLNKYKLSSINRALNLINDSLGECETCFYLTVDGVCPICSDWSRNQYQILVTSSYLEAKTIEETKNYHGLYAIVKGEINLKKGVVPDDLKIKNIFNRLHSETEVILAFNTTFNGELTLNYIKDAIVNQEVKISRLANGIPNAGTLTNIDITTLGEAIDNRKNQE